MQRMPGGPGLRLDPGTSQEHDMRKAPADYISSVIDGGHTGMVRLYGFG
jgi:hypothetical protein